MNLAYEAPQWLAVAFAILLIAAAFEDALRLRISNVTVVLVMIAAVTAAIVSGFSISMWQNLAVFASLLLVGTPIYSAGKLGGGDVKLLAATGLWFTIKGAALMLVAVMLAGGALAVIVLILRTFSWSEAARKRAVILRPQGGIPYGVAIAVGALIEVALVR